MDRFIADLEKQKKTAKEVNMDSKIDDTGKKYLGKNPFFTLYANVNYLLRQILHIEVFIKKMTDNILMFYFSFFIN
jgi:hypothetical protein